MFDRELKAFYLTQQIKILFFPFLVYRQ